jgi:uncharacterized protein (UPF0264 family)
VRRACPPRIPVSIALGELAEPHLAKSLTQIPTGSQAPAYAKFGLAGCRDDPQWDSRWHWAIQQLPRGTAPVAVVYADAARAGAPAASTIIDLAPHLGCRAVLWDTFDKSQGRLFELVAMEQLAEQTQQARTAGLLVVLAGSLALTDLPALARCAPDYVAVRGAVCQPDRGGMLRGYLVRQWVARLGLGGSHATLPPRSLSQ